ncbi:hypothetical protein KBZ14_00450 [Synechococcus sp. HJ21-Hayes]|nr:hypothetical protein [Synechococcus sp. JJ3a-Johnson]MCP9851342.1 hypothetical protein [Synechococcus sp. HJ21-Hayes]
MCRDFKSRSAGIPSVRPKRSPCPGPLAAKWKKRQRCVSCWLGSDGKGGSVVTASQADVEPRDRALFRTSRRVSVTLSHMAYSRLLKRSDEEGRSLSNLSAFLLESSLGVAE